MKRLTIIVPFRDRHAHLRQFMPHLNAYFAIDAAHREIPYNVLIIEQEDGPPFNAGALKNIGYLLARQNSDYACFHDVDYLPILADYSWAPSPTLILWYGAEARPIAPLCSPLVLNNNLDELFGGAVLIPHDLFARVNGYPNCYWGWGCEDADLKRRFLTAGIALGCRKGTFLALDHDNRGFTIDGRPAPIFETNVGLFQENWKSGGRIGEDGLSTLEFEILARRDLQESRSGPRWELVTVRLNMQAGVEQLQALGRPDQSSQRNPPAPVLESPPERPVPQHEIPQALRHAATLFDQGHLSQAECACHWILATRPDQSDALRILGAIKLQSGSYQEGVNLTKAALQHGPDSAEALSNLGLGLTQLGQHDGAVATCDRALAIKPDFVPAFNNRGMSLFNLARYEEAVASYDKALAIAPNIVQVLENRGSALERLYRHEEATASYATARKLAPSIWSPANDATTMPFILLYHRITADHDPDPWGNSLSSRHLEEHLAVLGARYRVLPLSTFLEGWQEHRLASNSVAITFDDGYADNFHAASLLRRAGLPAAFFLTTDPIMGAGEFWWDELERLLLSNLRFPPELSIELSSRKIRLQPGMPIEELDVCWRTWLPSPTPRHRALLGLWRLCQGLDGASRRRLLDQLRASCLDPVPTTSRHRVLTPPQVAQLANNGLFSFGAHTRSHPSLPLLSHDQQRREIGESKSACEDLIGSQVSLFAYPFGHSAPNTIELVRSLGFAGACTALHAAAQPHFDPYRLPRLQAPDIGGETFEQYLLTHPCLRRVRATAAQHEQRIRINTWR